jgi:hypothetical protein
VLKRIRENPDISKISLLWHSIRLSENACMDKIFTIAFNFPLEDSSYVLALEATVEQTASDPVYRVYDFRIAGKKAGMPLLPPQEIKPVPLSADATKKIWVHKDSEKESAISGVLGKAIEADR